MPSPFSSQEYWENRYKTGGNSGAGSYNQLAEFKAAVINNFTATNNISSIIDYGVGDGNQLLFINTENRQYTGIDVSPTIIEKCKTLFAQDTTKRFVLSSEVDQIQAELVLSCDVIYHLIEDRVYTDYMYKLFQMSTKYVIIYSKNEDIKHVQHVRFRKFQQYINEHCVQWKLLEHIPNKYPQKIIGKDNSITSPSDFYIYVKQSELPIAAPVTKDINTFSLIILNYKRPQNTIQIVDKMKRYTFIDEIIISNGNSDASVNYTDSKVKIYNDYTDLNNIYSLDLRFVCGLRAKNEDIIIIDDDVLIEEGELHKIVMEYNKNPRRIVGTFGRNIIDNKYIVKNAFEECDVVLTKLLLCKKKLCSLFFVCKPLIEHIYKKGIPYGNGEDIFFSFIVNIYYKNRNYCVSRVSTKELAQNDAISHNSKHLPYRNELSSYLKTNYDMFNTFISGLNL